MKMFLQKLRSTSNFFKLVVPYFYGTEKRYARLGGLLLIALSQASTAYGYFFIQWNGRFYAALENKNLPAFYNECLVFIVLAVLYLVTYGFTRFYTQQYALRWRMWMTKNTLTKWLHYEKRGELEGSDQRIQEDLMRFTLIFERFFLECVNSILLIILFTPLLFTQTHNLYLLNIPLGWILLSASIIYTLVGMLISAKIANPLIQLEYNSQRVEAELRYNLVHVRDGASKTSEFFNTLLDRISSNYLKIYKRQKNFNLWQKGYDQFSFLIPFMLLSSNYFLSLLTLSAVMQVRSTFSRIRNSMAYLLDHYTELTEMLAISKRLVEFYESVNIDFSIKAAKPISIQDANPAI